MATIVPSSAAPGGSRAITETTMTSSDTLAFAPGTGQILTLRNATGSAKTITLTGDGSTTVALTGIPVYSVAGGYSTDAIPAGGVRAIPLDTIREWIMGTITITGGTGVIATLLNP